METLKPAGACRGARDFFMLSHASDVPFTHEIPLTIGAREFDFHFGFFRLRQLIFPQLSRIDTHDQYLRLLHSYDYTREPHRAQCAALRGAFILASFLLGYPHGRRQE